MAFAPFLRLCSSREIFQPGDASMEHKNGVANFKFYYWSQAAMSIFACLRI